MFYLFEKFEVSVLKLTYIIFNFSLFLARSRILVRLRSLSTLRLLPLFFDRLSVPLPLVIQLHLFVLRKRLFLLDGRGRALSLLGSFLLVEGLLCIHVSDAFREGHLLIELLLFVVPGFGPGVGSKTASLLVFDSLLHILVFFVSMRDVALVTVFEFLQGGRSRVGLLFWLDLALILRLDVFIIAAFVIVIDLLKLRLG
jgi:hypothetical protein